MKNRSIFSKMDKPLFLVTTLYFILGAIIILSASSVSAVVKYEVGPYYFFIRQCAFILAGYLVGFLILLKFPTKFYKKIVHILLLGFIFSLVILLLYGQLTNNAKSWFDLGLFSVQPSEFIKILLILYLGIYFNDVDEKKEKKYWFLIPMIVCAVSIVLVAAQPDLGTALIIGMIVLAIFLTIPFEKNKLAGKLKILGWIGIGAVIFFLIAGKSLLTEEQQTRFEFSEPCTRYTEKTGYQVCNGFIAIHNGGLFGVGLGNSSQKYLYLPEAHTDFIFPILVEELGCIIGVMVILGYVFIIFRLLKISKECYTMRNSIVVFGIMIYILIHISVNFLGILALIPLTGVPVPFLSYGGSYSFCLVIALFIVQRINIENKIYRKNMEIKNIAK